MSSPHRRDLLVFAAVAPLFRSATASAAPAGPVLEVDATAVFQHLLRARLRLPVRPGPLVLVYPKWLPGEHSPSGRIEDIVGLTITAAGKPLPWQRDAEDMYAIACEIPSGVTSIDVSYEYAAGTGGRGAPLPAVASQQLFILKWNHVLLYPKGADPKSFTLSPSLRLPAGWTAASALAVVEKRGEVVRFESVSLETLVDSPVAAGAHGRIIDLSPPGGPPHDLAIFADTREALGIKDAAVTAYRALVTEARALFGGWPYRKYRFLLSLSDHVPHGGLEHHESSDNRIGEKSLVDDAHFSARAGLLPHEHVHAWNGKLRRPEGLATRDFQEPMKTEHLWIYEGLTSYLGEVLAARAGLRTAQEALDFVAYTAATMDARTGRRWRSVADTAVSAPMLTKSVRTWRGLRRGLDYYPEAQLVWLEADVTIRQRTQGARSFDDFCAAFFGKHASGAPKVVPYAIEEVLAGLNAVCPLDWKTFFRDRIEAITPRLPIGGIIEGGWKLVWKDAPTAYQRRVEQAGKEIDHAFSLGLMLRDDGGIIDVLTAGPAWKAGVGPAGTLVAVNGRRFNRERLAQAIAATRGQGAGAVDLLVESQESYRTHRLAWKEGLRYPALERVASKPDLLTAILTRKGG